MAKADDAELVEVAGRVVRISSPGKTVFYSRRKADKAGHRSLLSGGGAGGAAGHHGSSRGSEEVCEWRGSGAVLSEARTERPA